MNRGRLRMTQGPVTVVNEGGSGSALRALPGTAMRSSDASARTNLSVGAAALERMWTAGLAASVVGLVDCLVNDARRPNGLLANGLARATFNDMLLRKIALGLPPRPLRGAGAPRARGAAPPRPARGRLHADAPPRMAEVAAAAGCSLRTLEASYGRARGVTPLAALRAIRLDRVRDALRRCEGSSVSDLARRYGFTNAGRFAAAYRRRFGKLPSETGVVRPLGLLSRSGR